MSGRKDPFVAWQESFSDEEWEDVNVEEAFKSGWDARSPEVTTLRAQVEEMRRALEQADRALADDGWPPGEETRVAVRAALLATPKEPPGLANALAVMKDAVAKAKDRAQPEPVCGFFHRESRKACGLAPGHDGQHEGW